MKFRKISFYSIAIVFVCLQGNSQIAYLGSESNQKATNRMKSTFENSAKANDQEYTPIVGPSFAIYGCSMQNKSLSTFIETYNQVNATSLVEPMKSIGFMTGYKYGFTFCTQSSRDLPILWYVGQQKHGGSMEAVLIDGYTRKIDFTQKDIVDITAYYPLNRTFYLGGKMAYTTQTIDAYRMYGQDKVYDPQASLTGVYRSFVGNFTLGLEFKANFKINKWINVSPSFAYQSTFGKGSSSYFTKAIDQWKDNDSPNSYYFPADYSGYLVASANYNILPIEGLLKPRNRTVQASISILFNIGHLF